MSSLVSAYFYLNIMVAVCQFICLFEIIKDDGPQNTLLNVCVLWTLRSILLFSHLQYLLLLLLLIRCLLTLFSPYPLALTSYQPKIRSGFLLIFPGIIIITSIRGLLLTMTKFFYAVSSSKSANIIVLMFAQVKGMYFVASVLLMRMNMPLQYR